MITFSSCLSAWISFLSLLSLSNATFVSCALKHNFLQTVLRTVYSAFSVCHQLDFCAQLRFDLLSLPVLSTVSLTSVWVFQWKTCSAWPLHLKFRAILSFLPISIGIYYSKRRRLSMRKSFASVNTFIITNVSWNDRTLACYIYISSCSKS